MPIDLSTRERAAYDFISSYFAEYGISPTIHEVRKGLGLSSRNQVDRLLASLTEKRAITRMPGIWRGMRINRRAKITA